ncbi:MAG: hypothetical protein WC648_05055 [Candidatus Paceibacterota bacterium]|jgi:hypothetical protein
MIYKTPSLEKKHELESKGYTCNGAHTIYNGKLVSGKYEYEFTLPDDYKEITMDPSTTIPEEIKDNVTISEPIKIVKRVGNPNWTKGGKKK